VTILQGDCLEVMRSMESNSIDFIITDPPYGLNFMGKDWDKEIPGTDIWKECLRISKSGCMLAAFGGTRTHHHLMLALENSGWEIRDCICWLYGSGFPKSHNKFGLEGYGTALKPAYEPIILAMKSCEGTFAQNAEKWGLAGLNIDESRIETTDNRSRINNTEPGFYGGWGAKNSESHPKGRWPSNLILDEESAKMLDEQAGHLIGAGNAIGSARKQNNLGFCTSPERINYKYDKGGGASRFFYCAKSSIKERGSDNKHPTVKPIALMRYIIKLLAPPNDPLLLDPFAGSGSTLIAAKELGIRSIGIELNPEYCEIARNRIAI
jgi:DNA modification methylase